MQFGSSNDQKDGQPQQPTFQFKFNFNFANKNNAQQQNQNQEQEKKEEETKAPLSKEEQLKQLPSAKESIYFKVEQIKYFAWIKQNDGKGKYEKQDQLIGLQIYKQETTEKTNNCIKIYYKNQVPDAGNDQNLFVQDIFFSVINKDQPKIEYIKGKGVRITGLNYLHQEIDKNGKSTGSYQISTYYLKLSDEQMDNMKKVCDDVNENKEIKPLEVIETGKFLENKEETKKENKEEEKKQE